MEQSVGSIAACVNPRRQHEARHRNMSEPTPTARSAAPQRWTEPAPTARSEASGQLLGLWFHDLGPACLTLGVSGGAAQRAPISIPPCRTPVLYRCWGELRAPRVCVHMEGGSNIQAGRILRPLLLIKCFQFSSQVYICSLLLVRLYSPIYKKHKAKSKCARAAGAGKMELLRLRTEVQLGRGNHHPTGRCAWSLY